jgi:hypothetical protein
MKVAVPNNVAVILCIKWDTETFFMVMKSAFEEAYSQAQDTIGEFILPAQLKRYLSNNEEWESGHRVELKTLGGWDVFITLGTMK